MAFLFSNPLSLLRWLGPILLVALILWAKPAELAAVFKEANVLWLLAAWLLNLPQLGLKALRWQRMVRWQGVALPYGRAVLAYYGSLLVGFLTPGRLGEAAKAFTLRYDYGMPLAAALSSVVVDRIFDLYLLITLGLLGVVRFTLVGSVLPWPVFIGLCIVLFAPLLMLNQRMVRRVGGRLARWSGSTTRREWIEQKTGQFADGLAPLTVRRVMLCGLFTVCAYAIFFLQCQWCAWALGFSIPVVDLALLMSATNLMTFLPISISGLGTREACLVFFLGALAQPQAPSVAISYGLTLFLVMFVGGGLIGWVCWQWAPIGLRRAAADLRHRRGDRPGEETRESSDV